jgi:DtxR family manganese transport transcriptional regulator
MPPGDDPADSSGEDLERGRRARRFQRVRDAHQTEVAEDYVELIADLIERNGTARLGDLAECLGVSKPTVNGAIQRLQRDGLVRNERYRSILLTEKGYSLAQCSRERHRVVRELLIALGVDADTADADAEGIEHHVSEATLEAFRRHLAKPRRRARRRPRSN